VSGRHKRGRALNEQFQRLARGASSEEEALRTVAPLLEKGYDKQRAQDERFAAIRPPAADREIITRLWKANDENTALLGRLVDAARSQDVGRFTALAEEQKRATERARGLAEGYGFRECGSRKSEAG
jgi:hypothetical protein